MARIAKRVGSGVRFNLMSPGKRSDAWMIWTRGNVAVHHDAEATKDVYGTIEMTVGVLKELYA